MTNRFTQKAQNALNHALVAARGFGHSYVGSEHLLVGLTADGESAASHLLADKEITRAKIIDTITAKIGTGTPTDVTAADLTPRTKQIIEMSAYISARLGSGYIGTEHLLLSILEEKDCTALRILEALGIAATDLKSKLLSYFDDTSRQSIGMKPERIKAHTDVSLRDCPTLSSYGRNLTALAAAGKLDPTVGRDAETDRVIQILARRQKNNPCLIGEPGVGKTAVVEGLAKRIADGNVPEMLQNKIIVTVDIPSMLAGAKYRGEFEERLKNVMAEVEKRPDIILFIDEIHTLVGAGAAEGALDAANILKPALSRSAMQLIGATTSAEYRKNIEKDAALERRFQAVTVDEPSPEDAVCILRGLRDKYEAHHKLKISDDAIAAAVYLSARYIGDRYLPDKAIDLIDEAASRLRISGCTSPPDLRALEARAEAVCHDKEEAIHAQNFEAAAKKRDEEQTLRTQLQSARQAWQESRIGTSLTITREDIANIVTAWTGIPIKQIESEENTKLLQLDRLLKSRVIGQAEAADAVAKAIRRGRLGLKDPKRPLCSFLFLGPTGVGKTMLCRALADVLFGDMNAMIRIDMSEYAERHSISKLIGAPPGYIGYDDGGQLTEKVRRKPYSVILLDEVEKAHPDIWNLLLQVLEDGTLTDAQGHKADFKNSVIILTSNIGADLITHAGTRLGFSAATTDERTAVRTGVMQALKSAFRPELLNRLDEIIIFNRLTDENIRKITSLMLTDLKTRIEQLGINVTFSDSLIACIAERGFDPLYGARPLRRTITSLVEDSLAAAMLDGKIKRGDRIFAKAVEGKVLYEKQTINKIDAK